MLRHKQNDLLHILTMLETLEKIILYSKEVRDPEKFYELNEQLNFNAVLNLLTHLGETAKKLSKDLLRYTPEIEWKKIKGIRNRISHDYLGLDTFVIFEIIRKDVPILIEKLYPLLKLRIDDGTFDKNELNAAKGSMYYRHIDFLRL